MASFGERLELPGWLAVMLFACAGVGGVEANYGPTSFEIYIQNRVFYLETNAYSLIHELRANISGYESRIATLEATVVTLQNLIDALTPAASQPSVDGGYSQWGEWDCNCGSTMKTRLRLCNTPAPSGGGADCTSMGSFVEIDDCDDLSSCTRLTGDPGDPSAAGDPGDP